jgi:hypothetical protein
VPAACLSPKEAQTVIGDAFSDLDPINLAGSLASVFQERQALGPQVRADVSLLSHLGARMPEPTPLAGFACKKRASTFSNAPSRF